MLSQLLACFINLWTHADIWTNGSISLKKDNINSRLTMFANVMKTLLKRKTAHHDEIDVSMFEDTACAGRKIMRQTFNIIKISTSSCNPPRMRIIRSRYVFLSKGMAKHFCRKFPVRYNRGLQLKQSGWIGKTKLSLQRACMVHKHARL